MQGPGQVQINCNRRSQFPVPDQRQCQQLTVPPQVAFAIQSLQYAISTSLWSNWVVLEVLSQEAQLQRLLQQQSLFPRVPSTTVQLPDNSSLHRFTKPTEGFRHPPCFAERIHDRHDGEKKTSASTKSNGSSETNPQLTEDEVRVQLTSANQPLQAETEARSQRAKALLKPNANSLPSTEVVQDDRFKVATTKKQQRRCHLPVLAQTANYTSVDNRANAFAHYNLFTALRSRKTKQTGERADTLRETGLQHQESRRTKYERKLGRKKGAPYCRTRSPQGPTVRQYHAASPASHVWKMQQPATNATAPEPTIARDEPTLHAMNNSGSQDSSPSLQSSSESDDTSQYGKENAESLPPTPTRRKSKDEPDDHSTVYSCVRWGFRRSLPSLCTGQNGYERYVV